MSVLARTLLLLFTTSLLVGCESSWEFDACVFSDDPSGAAGGRRSACPSSVFNPEDARSREIAGVVRRGEDVVPGAIVLVDPSPGFTGVKSTTTLSTITDAVGFFGGLRSVALRYDLSVKLGEDLLFYRSDANRYFEPSLEGPRTFSRVHTSRVDLRLDRAIPDGRSVAFFANGEGVLTVSGDGASSLSVLHQEYTNPAAIHVVEYETSGGFEKATAYGKADVVLDPGGVRLARVVLEPVTTFTEPAFSVSAPPGAADATIEIRLFFSRTSDALVATVPPGAPRKIPVIPNASYTYRAGATVDGATVHSGDAFFDPSRPVTEIELPAPPIVASPAEGEVRGAGETLLVDGKGVFEHVLVPEGGGRTMRIITRQRDAALPDPTSLGAAPASGPHSWTVRSFPTVRFAEELSGLDVRRHHPMGVSRSRSIVLR